MAIILFKRSYYHFVRKFCKNYIVWKLWNWQHSVSICNNMSSKSFVYCLFELFFVCYVQGGSFLSFANFKMVVVSIWLLHFKVVRCHTHGETCEHIFIQAPNSRLSECAITRPTCSLWDLSQSFQEAGCCTIHSDVATWERHLIWEDVHVWSRLAPPEMKFCKHIDIDGRDLNLKKPRCFTYTMYNTRSTGY